MLSSDLASITEQGQPISQKHPWQFVVFGLLYELRCSEANHYSGYLEILGMLVVLNVHVATEIMDSDFSDGILETKKMQKEVELQPWSSYVRQPLLDLVMDSILSYHRTITATLLGIVGMFRGQPTLIEGMRRNFPDGCERDSMEEHFSYLQYVQLQLWRPTHTHGSALGEQQSGFNFWPVKLRFRDNYAHEAWYCCIFDTWIMSKLMGITSQDDAMYGVNFTFSFLHAHSGEQVQSLTQDFSCMCFLNDTYVQFAGSRAKVQFTSLITFKGCSPLGATTFGDNTHDMPSATSKQTIAEDIYAKTTCWTLIQLVVIALHDNDPSMLFPLHFLRNWCLARGSLLDIILRVLRCPSHAVSKLDGMVDKTEPISKMGIRIHLSEQQLTLLAPDEDVYAHKDIQAAIYVHKSWDPGGVTMPACNPQPSKILRLMLTSHEAQPMSGMSSSQCSDEEHFQGGGNVIAVVLDAGLLQGYIDHMYYISFYKDYFLDTSFGQVAIGHGYYNLVIQLNYDFELVKEHRVQWDPGGSRWHRLEGKPIFKEEGMLGALLTQVLTWALPIGPAHGPSCCWYKYLEESNERGIQWITAIGTAASSSSPTTSGFFLLEQFFLYLVL